MPTFSARSRRWSSPALLALCAGLFGVPLADADTLADVQRLYYGGQREEAMRRADEGLAANAGDPPLRFMKGVMLADAKHGAEATAIFLKLTQDYPDLAEPYNNLAALYAENGAYDKAREALMEALRVNPSYATAYENLGDIYTALAAQAYARALRLDPLLAAVSPKLDAVRRVYKRDDAPPPPGAARP